MECSSVNTVSKAYLAGPITGLTHDESVDWRDYAKGRLAEDDSNIVGYSPMRAKEYLREVGVISGRPEAYDDYILSSAKGIMYRDSWDCATADLILVNFMGAEKISVGTVMEIAMGWAYRKPVVIAMEDSNPHHHPMLDVAAGWICPDLDYAIDIARAILLPDGVKVAA